MRGRGLTLGGVCGRCGTEGTQSGEGSGGRGEKAAEGIVQKSPMIQEAPHLLLLMDAEPSGQ